MNEPTQNPYAATPVSQVEGSPEQHREKVRAVAKAQRLLNIAILVYLLLIGANVVSQLTVAQDPDSIVPLLVLPFVLGALVFIVFAVARMGYTMHGVAHAILYSIAMLIPCLGIILLLILNSRVTKFLSENGVKVGLLGADKASIP